MEQNAEKADAHDGVYGPCLVMARRKNGTRSLEGGGTSPNQSSRFSFRDNGNGDKGSLERAVRINWLSREVKRKLPHPNSLDKAQIASVVQNIRSEGQLQAQSSKILMFKRVNSNYTSTWPKSASISHGLSLMKGKKVAPCNNFSFGDQSSVVGVLSLSSVVLSQPKVCANPLMLFLSLPPRVQQWASKAKLRANLIRAMMWFSLKHKKVQKLPLMERSVKVGRLPYSDPIWETPVPCSVKMSECLTERRNLGLMGIKQITAFILLLVNLGMEMGVLQVMVTLFLGESKIREVLRRRGWILKVEVEVRSLSVDCPIPPP